MFAPFFQLEAPSGPLARLVAGSRALLSPGDESEEHFATALSGPTETLRFERAGTHLAFGEWLCRRRRVSAAREQRTVESHLSRVIAKVGVTSRKQLPLSRDWPHLPPHGSHRARFRAWNESGS